MGTDVPFPFGFVAPNNAQPEASVYSVDKVESFLQKSNPPILNIRAEGSVPTGGWTGAALEPRYYIVPPADGIWDFDFVAVPPAPGTPVSQGFETKKALFAWNDPPPYLRGVRVHARTNAIKHVFLEDGPELTPAVEAEKSSVDVSKLNLAVSVPETIFVNKQPIVPPALPVSLVVGLVLSNTSGETQQLYAPTPCDIFNWWVEDGAGNVVQREPPVMCIKLPQFREIGSRQIIPAKFTIVLDGHLYSTGTYTLKVTFWGKEGEAALNIQELS